MPMPRLRARLPEYICGGVLLLVLLASLLALLHSCAKYAATTWLADASRLVGVW